MLKSLFCKSFLAVLGGLFLFGGLSAACGSIFDGTSTETKMESTAIDEAPYACKPNAIKAEDKPRYRELAKKVKSGREEVKETPEGYALRFPADSLSIREIAEFITFERECCPFIHFEIIVEKDNGAVWLRMEGGEEVKEILSGEFAV